jgi:AcrR family transcriptional regulator
MECQRVKKRAPEIASEEADARVRRSKQAVLAAAIELLTETGLQGVSIDAVSRRSRVAKTTIYRHWPSRSALLLDACSKLGPRPEIPDTGTIAGDVAQLLRYAATQLSTARWTSVLPSIIDAAERDPEIAAMHSRLHAGLMVPFRAVVERAQQRGELAPDRDPAELVAAIVGPMFYRRWFSREKLDAAFVANVVADLAGGRSASAAKPRASRTAPDRRSGGARSR